MIAVNGPNLSHCDNSVKEAMDSYWRSKGSSSQWTLTGSQKGVVGNGLSPEVKRE